MGDSISAAYGIQRDQGWVALLEARLATLAVPHQVVNASISGDTTGGALARLPRALEVHKPDLVIIEVGGNDALRGYPIDRIAQNLDAMVTLSKNAGAAVLVLGMEIPPNYGARYTQAFHDMYSAGSRARRDTARAVSARRRRDRRCADAGRRDSSDRRRPAAAARKCLADVEGAIVIPARGCRYNGARSWEKRPV